MSCSHRDLPGPNLSHTFGIRKKDKKKENVDDREIRTHALSNRHFQIPEDGAITLVNR